MATMIAVLMLFTNMNRIATTSATPRQRFSVTVSVVMWSKSVRS